MAEVIKATGLFRRTLNGWARGTVQRLTSKNIVTLCEFFECGVGDLLVYVPDEDDPNAP